MGRSLALSYSDEATDSTTREQGVRFPEENGRPFLHSGHTGSNRCRLGSVFFLAPYSQTTTKSKNSALNRHSEVPLRFNPH